MTQKYDHRSVTMSDKTSHSAPSANCKHRVGINKISRKQLQINIRGILNKIHSPVISLKEGM